MEEIAVSQEVFLKNDLFGKKSPKTQTLHFFPSHSLHAHLFLCSASTISLKLFSLKLTMTFLLLIFALILFIFFLEFALLTNLSFLKTFFLWFLFYLVKK